MKNVNVIVNGLNLFIKNNFFSATFSDAHATELRFHGHNLVSNLGNEKSFYVDYNNGKNILFKPESLKLLELNESFAHVAYYKTSKTDISIEQHYIINSTLSGIYSYVLIRNVTTKTLSIAELRMVCRFNPNLMPYVNNGKMSMKPKLYAELEKYEKVQDETWLLPDGTYYSKYDLAGYIRERDFYGVFGSGIGAWFIHPSHEYFSGGPLKQDLIVHQDALMIVYMSGAHFGTPVLEMPPGFNKLYGPWVIYFNYGNNSELIDNVKNQAKNEKTVWPYSWVKESLYPLARGTVIGKVDGMKSEVVLSPKNEEFDLQVRGYSWNTETKEDGTFYINGVRPGKWLLSVYPLEGAAAGFLQQKEVQVTADSTTDAGKLTITEPNNILWQIGKANRRSTGYQYSAKERNYCWQLLTPENITFIVGSSNPATDWYYAQNKIGSWRVEFNDIPDHLGRLLKLSIAAASSFSSIPKLHVYVNSNLLGSLSLSNDKAIYRGAMQSGNYYISTLYIPADQVLNGKNTLTLNLVSGAFMYDTLVYLRG